VLGGSQFDVVGLGFGTAPWWPKSECFRSSPVARASHPLAAVEHHAGRCSSPSPDRHCAPRLRYKRLRLNTAAAGGFATKRRAQTLLSVIIRSVRKSSDMSEACAGARSGNDGFPTARAPFSSTRSYPGHDPWRPGRNCAANHDWANALTAREIITKTRGAGPTPVDPYNVAQGNAGRDSRDRVPSRQRGERKNQKREKRGPPRAKPLVVKRLSRPHRPLLPQRRAVVRVTAGVSPLWRSGDPVGTQPQARF
jgi:hypothetical protein